ncbi:MAG: heat-inducible transcription repressor HrcA [Anaerolineaceae bacterium]|nr:MAG: heat-inducible transcription repressor HrcA [Anaerolineaceae bacterium]
MSMDAARLPELTTRQEKILSFIIRAYTETPEPVSSKHVHASADLGVSPATIRNEMAVLEELGYIIAPHTSAGRVPTESGYRYFVSRLLNHSALTDSEKKHITVKFQSLPTVTEQWMRTAASILARTAQSASLVTAPIAETTRFKHLELVPIQGRLVLLVLVLHGGIVQQRMLNLAEPVAGTRLSEAASHINALCADLYAHQIRVKSIQLSLLEREVAELVAEVMERADSSPSRTIYRDGLSEVMRNFQGGEGAQQMVRVFEERAFLDIILSDFVNPDADDVRVIVGGDGRWEELSQLSLVLSRYGVPGQITGTVGILGPTHINYGRAINTVRYVSGLMTDMLVELYDDQGAGEDSASDAPDEPD